MKPNRYKKPEKMDKILSKFTSGRTKSIKKRKKTLLMEYKLMNKSNKFIDRRIGEKDRSMTAEDRLMARFITQKRKSQNKKQMFNLSNDEEVLTHHGRILQDLEKFDNPQSESDDDEDGKLEAEYVGKAHFGGGLFSRTVNDGGSYQSTIDKLIAESKIRKAERQQTKEETENLTDKLDKDLKELLSVIDKKYGKDDDGLVRGKPDPQSYDVLVRELKFERVGKPCDKLKSEDEIVHEEKQKLDKLRKEQLIRMQCKEPVTKKHPSADDLDDGFDLDVYHERDESAKVNGFSSDNFDDDHNHHDEDDIHTYYDSEDENDSDGDGENLDSSKQYEKLDCSSLKSLLEKHDYAGIKQSIFGTSRDNLVTSFNFILEHIDFLFKKPVISDSWHFVSKLSSILFEINQKCADETAKVMFTVLKKKERDFNDNIKSELTTDMLIFLKLVPLLFPTSDYYHPVATPSTVLICQILSQNTCKTLNCISKGLFLTTLMLEYITLSNRYCPEVMNFLRNVLYVAVPNFEDLCPPVNIKNKILTLSISYRNECIKDEKLQLPWSFTTDNVVDSDETKLSVIYATLKILFAYSSHYDKFSTLSAIWSPICNLLEKLPVDQYPKNIETKIESLKDRINVICNRSLQYLVGVKKRPKALRLYEPNIRPVIDGRSFRIVSQAKLEKEKLVHQYKREMKGALREIRKDKNFLARVKMTEQAKKDAERREKVKRIFGWGQNQQSEFKQIERKKRFKR